MTPLLFAAVLPAVVISQLTATITSQTNESCVGRADGALTVTASGGVAPYAYEWTPGSPVGDGSPAITQLTQGTYVVTVTDATNATASAMATVTRRSTISLTRASQTNVACHGGRTGAALANPASGGFGSVVYDWTPGMPAGDGTLGVSGLPAGNWVLTATDALNCSASVTFFIVEPPPVVVPAASQTNVSCHGGSNASASVSPASGGSSPPYSYDWSPGSPVGDGSLTATGLSAGTWVLTATDAIGCTGAQTFEITEPEPLAIAAANVQPVSCHGANDGGVTLSASGGSGAYGYSWSPGDPNGEGTNAISELGPGIWSVLLSDANGCTLTQAFNVTEPSALLLSPASQADATCFGGSDGAASLAAPTGGVGPYLFDWGPGAPSGDGGAAVSGLSAGDWSVVVTDASGCQATQSFTIGQGAEINLAVASQTSLSCLGASDGAVTIQPAAGGAGGFSYDWSPGSPVGDGSTSVSALSAGVYTVTATDANACTRSLPIEVTGPVILDLTSVVSPPLCAGDENGVIRVNVLGGAAPYGFVWGGGALGDGSGTLSGVAAGSYEVKVADANGCYATSVVSVDAPTPLVANGQSRGVSAAGACDAEASVAPAGGTPPYVTTWSPQEVNQTSLTEQCAAVATAAVRDANGCSTSFTADLGEQTADLSVALTSQVSSLKVGEVVSLVASVASSPRVAGATMSLSFPPELSVRSSNVPPGWTCACEEALTCSTADALDSAEITVELVLGVMPTSADVVVRASVTSVVNDPAANNNQAEVTLAVQATPLPRGCGGCAASGNDPALALFVLLVGLCTRQRARIRSRSTCTRYL